MFTYVVLALACAIGTVSCIDCSTNCQQEKWDSVSRDLPSEICQAGKNWRNCLDQQLMQRCDDVMSLYTQELNNADRSCGVTDPAPADPCDVSACSEEDAINNSNDSQEKCQLARKWRSCLDSFLGSCTVAFPFALDHAEARNCYDNDNAPVDAGADDNDDDASDAPVVDDAADDADDKPTDDAVVDDAADDADDKPTDDAVVDDDVDDNGDDSIVIDDVQDDDDDQDDDEPKEKASTQCLQGFSDCEDKYVTLVNGASGDKQCAMALGWEGCEKIAAIQNGCPADYRKDQSKRRTDAYCWVAE